MKTFLFAAVAAATLAAAMPASAEPALRGGPRDAPSYERHDDGRGYDNSYRRQGGHLGRYGAPDRYAPVFTRSDLDRLQYRIDRNYDRGSLTRREARWLTAQVHDLRHLARDYWRTGAGIGPRERRDLEFRYQELSRRIHWEVADRNYR